MLACPRKDTTNTLSWAGPQWTGGDAALTCPHRLQRVTMSMLEILMWKEYVKNIGGVYRVGDTRISLDSLVYLFREGMSAEGMVESYPALTLEQVHGALAFYLAG